jgi:flagellar protein FlgJ
MLNSSQSVFLTEAALAALQSEEQTGCPAALTLAQAIFESGWGAHLPGNNAFGIKWHVGVASQLLPTTEYFTLAEVHAFLALGCGRTAVITGTVQHNGRYLYHCTDLFAAYPTLAAGFEDHARLITAGAPYAAAWAAFQQDRDFDKFVLAVGARYATAPLYGQQILSMAKSDTVQGALAAAGAAQ